MADLPTTDMVTNFDASVSPGNLYTTVAFGTGALSGTVNDGDQVGAWVNTIDATKIFRQKVGGTTFLPSDITWENDTVLFKPSIKVVKGTLESVFAGGSTELRLNDFASTTARTVVMSFMLEGSTGLTNNATVYLNTVLIGTGQNGFGALHLRKPSGIDLYAYNWDGNADSASIALTVSTPYVLVWRHDGSTMYLTIIVAGGTETNVSFATGTTGDNGVWFIADSNPAGTQQVEMRVGQVTTYDANLTGTPLSDLKTYYIDKWLTNSPLVNAGPDQSIILPPGTFTLAGSATGGVGALTYQWTQVSGPPAGVIVFDDDTDPVTTGSASIAGVYVLELEADDGSTIGSDTMTLTVGLTPTGGVIAFDDVALTRIIEPEGRRGIRIQLPLGSSWLADLTTYDNDSTAGAYRPDIRQWLSLDYEGQRLFRGQVTTVRDSPRARTNMGNRSAVTAKANVLITDQMQLDEFEVVAGQTLKQVVTAIQTYGSPSMADAGIALDPTMPNGPTLDATTFDGISIQEAFNRLMDRTGSIIRITPDDVLEAFAPGDKVCDYALTTANKFALGPITWEKTLRKFVNRATVEYGTGRALRVDNFVGDGSEDTFTLSLPISGFYAYTSAGAVGYGVVDYPAGPTTESLGGPTSPMIWQYDPDALTITRTLGAVANGVAFFVRYDVQYPQRITVEDAVSIAADGLWARTYKRPDIFEPSEAEEEADGLLRVNGETPKIIKLRTKQYPMPLPGDIINLNFPERLIADDDYLIIRVDAEDYADQKYEFVLTCVEGVEVQQSWTETLRQLIGAS
jgi:hypothetical protein